MREFKDLSFSIIGACFRVHARLGPGLLESVYESVLADDLSSNMKVERQVPVPLVVDGKHFDVAFRADLIVEDSILLEIKSVPALDKAHFKQTLTYTKILDYRLGLLINFGSDKLEIKRIVNKLSEK